MSSPPLLVSGRAAELRRAFDDAFALPPHGVTEETENLLGIRVSGEAYAIRLVEMAGLVVGRKIVPFASRRPELIGLAGVRGGIVPVCSLRVLLGYPPADEAPRWLVLIGTTAVMALAFDAFDGYLRAPRSSLAPQAGTTPAPKRAHVGDVVCLTGTLRGVIDMRSVLETLTHRALTESPQAEVR